MRQTAAASFAGDETQSIYSRAVIVRAIPNFPGLVEPTTAVVTLERDYSSKQELFKKPKSASAAAVLTHPYDEVGNSWFPAHFDTEP